MSVLQIWMSILQIWMSMPIKFFKNVTIENFYTCIIISSSINYNDILYILSNWHISYVLWLYHSWLNFTLLHYPFLKKWWIISPFLIVFPANLNVNFANLNVNADQKFWWKNRLANLVVTTNNNVISLQVELVTPNKIYIYI